MDYRGLLLDLEGVLHQGDLPIPGAVESLRALRQRGIAIRYLTNTTTRPRRGIAQRLRSLGFAVQADEVFTPPAATARLLAELGTRRIHLEAACHLECQLARDLIDELIEDDPIDLREAKTSLRQSMRACGTWRPRST